MNKIALSVKNGKGKNVFFVLDDLRALLLEDVVPMVKAGLIDNAKVITDKNGEKIIKSLANANKSDNFSLNTITIESLKNPFRKRRNNNLINQYLISREKLLNEKLKANGNGIFIDEVFVCTKQEVLSHILQYKDIILSASDHFKIDPYLLGAILIDEFARVDIKDCFDWAALLEFETSVGVAQVKVERARVLIKNGYYNPNPGDVNFSLENIKKTKVSCIYRFLLTPKHSIYFAAANIKRIIDRWISFVDLSKRPEIIGTLYSIGDGEPKTNPQPNDRGLQIANEFYSIAKGVLLGNE